MGSHYWTYPVCTMCLMSVRLFVCLFVCVFLRYAALCIWNLHRMLLVLSSLYHVFDVRLFVCVCVCVCVSPLRSTLHLEFTYNVSVVLFLRSAALCIWNFIQNHYFDTVQNVQNVGLMKEGAEPMVLSNHFTLDDIPRYYSQSQMGYRRV